MTQNGPEVAVALTEPRFNETGRGNRFTGRVVGAVASSLDGFDEDSVFASGYLPSIAERLPNGEFLVVSGTAVATASGWGLSGHLNGSFTGWGSGFPTNPLNLGFCYSATHRFTLMPR